ncbi:MAG: Fic family protein [Chloroflexota bacterium]|nr:Fic family protein [Chloroflexota bacterium]MDE2669713.1 Fic family protein [Chloroflexota bacterium]
MGGLPNRLEAEAAAIWEGIWFEEAHHSTAIEGNTLVLRQVEALLAEGRTVGQKPLSEYMEVQGYAKAAAWVYDHGVEDAEWTSGEVLTLAEIRHVHSLAMGPVWDVAPHPDASPEEGPGAFRKHDIQPFPGGMIPPPWTDVPALVGDWLKQANTLRGGDLEFPLALARLHCGFEQIHPFLDGNGRAGRLILNLMLVRLGYPPVIIYKRQRLRYLRALRRADQGDTGALGELLARALLDNLNRFIIPAVAGPARLVPLAALATSGISTNALRAAANRGRLQATRGSDGQWRSTIRWRDEYLATRYTRGSMESHI